MHKETLIFNHSILFQEQTYTQTYKYFPIFLSFSTVYIYIYLNLASLSYLAPCTTKHNKK